jgi:ribosomal protein L44E
MPSKKARTPSSTPKPDNRPKLLPTGARPAADIKVAFTCWNCKTHSEADLEEVQQDRLSISYGVITPDPNQKKRYFLRCSSCQRFNSVTI